MMNFDELIKERYSVRKFKKEKVSKEVIKELLETLNYIPTAINAQPERVYVLNSKEALEKINKYANTFQAPLVLLIASDTEIAWHNLKEEGYHTGEMDGSITATYLMLKAWDLGLGSVWIRSFNANYVKEAFELPNNIKPICLLAIGYASEDSVPSPRHFEKKPLDDLVKFL